MSISQHNRLMQIDIPLCAEAFVMLSFSGDEAISELFNFKLQLASERKDLAFEKLAGQNVTVTIRSSDGAKRYFNGIIVALAPDRASDQEGCYAYRAVMAPAAWALQQCHDCRLFQDKSVAEIIKQVLDPSGLGPKKVNGAIDYRMALTGVYSKKELCVQYNESDFAFIRRLCEDEGIYFYFEHEHGKHTLVFADAPGAHKPCAPEGRQTVRFQNTLGGTGDQEGIVDWTPARQLAAAKYVARDFNFKIPTNDMTVEKSSRYASPQSQGEQYEYPGGYEKTGDQGQRRAMIRMQVADVRGATVKGAANVRAFAPGFTFILTDHPLTAMNGKTYLLTHVGHKARQQLTSGLSDGDSYDNQFACIAHEVPYRSERKTAKPVIAGNQTAIVTGPQGEEIHTDEHGRVKVKFHWDRRQDERRDGDMSCWMRVSQTWAGAKYGGLHIPRVGQEVVVGFLDGDPDRPMVTGRVYNAHNKPPCDLPAEKTRSTIKSDSSKNGGNSNEIRFEDLAGSEEFFTHAAKDQNEVIENDMRTEVKNNQAIEVKQNRSIVVMEGGEQLAVQKGGRDVSVQSDEKHTNAANFTHKVAAGYTLKVNGNLTIDASGIVQITGAKIILNG
jgi:type VI secretion system secreted protein VgrG